MQNKELIQNAKNKIAELSAQENAIFDQLLTDLQINDENREGFLFDYIYNDFESNVISELIDPNFIPTCKSCETNSKMVKGDAGWVCHGTHRRD